MTLDEVKEVFHRYLYLPNDSIIDLIAGVIVANCMDIDSVNLYLVGPSGSGKTELIRSLNGYSRVYPMGTVTEHTFLSGYGGEKFNGRASLLLKLQKQGKKIITIKEFTAILEQKEDTRRKVLSTIREIADGQVDRDVGNNVSVHWKGRLAFIAGVTGVIDKHYSVTQQLGERFLYYRMVTDNELMPVYALNNAGRITEMRYVMEDAMAKFLAQFDGREIEPVEVPPLVAQKIFQLSRFISGARTTISKDRFSRTLDYMVEMEVPTRLIQQLHNVAMGVAIAQGKTAVDRDIYERVIARIGRDSTHSIRKAILQMLWMNKVYETNWTYQTSLCNLLRHIPRSTSRAYLEDMVSLGIIEEREIGNKMEYRMTDTWVNIIRDSGVYDGVALKPVTNIELLEQSECPPVQDSHESPHLPLSYKTS